MSLLSDTKRGTGEDKLRLLLVYFLNNENFNSSDLKEYTEVLQQQGVDTSPLTWAIKFVVTLLFCGNGIGLRRLIKHCHL
jgi:hypothetical protein